MNAETTRLLTHLFTYLMTCHASNVKAEVKLVITHSLTDEIAYLRSSQRLCGEPNHNEVFEQINNNFETELYNGKISVQKNTVILQVKGKVEQMNVTILKLQNNVSCT